jgi:hypothetical protein
MIYSGGSVTVPLQGAAVSSPPIKVAQPSQVAFRGSQAGTRYIALQMIGTVNPQFCCYPSLVCTTISTRRFGLCSSIEPAGETRNFVAP